MADLTVRGLDDRVLAELKARAQRHGLSLEEEIRRTLTESVAVNREAFIRRAAACREASKPPPGITPTDSTEIIRAMRDAWG